MKLLIMSSLVFGIACGDDDVLPLADAGPMDAGGADVPGLDIQIFDGGDPCTGIDADLQCDTAGTTCAGDTLTVCEANANGCLVTSETDCSSDGASCDDSGAVAMCTSDPCMGITDCDTEARSCGADTLTVCAPDAMGCLVTTTTDCTDDGTTCDDTGAMALCVDACDGISDCDSESRSCDADSLVVCAPDAAGCLVETSTDCAETGAECDVTVDPIACVVPLCAPADASGIVLDCDTGSITGTTMGGTDDIDGYCGSGNTNYDSPEVVYSFGDTRSAVVTITVVREAASTLDMDLFVLNGGEGDVACGGDTSCRDGSVGGSDTETVDFDYLPGQTNYIAYDAYQATEGTTGFELSVTCVFSTCGDSAIEGPEACDDGNDDAMDGCDSLCQVEPGYLCTENAAGLSTCVLSCGDGVVNGDDECDDMNMTDADGCTACVVDMGFSCSGEPSVCVASCGNGVGDSGETCDDGNTMAGDGCAADCTVEGGFYCTNPTSDFGAVISVCGPQMTQIDGVLEDADTAWDRPSASCADGSTTTVFEAVEYTNSSGAEQTLDILANYAFDGFMHIYSDVVDPGTTATNCVVGNDDFEGSSNGGLQDVVVADGATIQIVISSYDETGRGDFSVFIVDAGFGCGNGLTDISGDDCDDGNTVDGDGCSALCAFEIGFECDDAEPTVCIASVCGNGVIESGEECDDMDADGGDGCSALCATETGFFCSGEPSVCEVSVCGNSMVEAGEVCDDGNTDDGDGCEGDCASAVFSGSLDAATDALYNRLDASCGTVGTTRDDVYYDVVPFVWNGTADASLRFDVDDGYDGYVHAYTNPFNAALPLDNCLTGNDDGGPGSRMTVDATAGQNIDVVLSTWNSMVTGDWELTVTLAP